MDEDGYFEIEDKNGNTSEYDEESGKYYVTDDEMGTI
jgi:hypothetical protein